MHPLRREYFIVPYRQLQDLYLKLHLLTLGSNLRPVNPLRSAHFDDAADIQLISPYHPSLALNGGGFPERFACYHLNLIRYIVRGASHQPHSAWQARPRRDRQEHAEYSRQTHKHLNTLNYATSCRTIMYVSRS